MIKSGAKLNYDFENGSLTLTLGGEIDHHSATALREKADELIYRLQPKRVYIDLYAIEFMDSSGLGFIMGRFSLVRKLGGELYMKNPSPSVSRILSLAGMERIIKTERNTK